MKSHCETSVFLQLNALENLGYAQIHRIYQGCAWHLTRGTLRTGQPFLGGRWQGWCLAVRPGLSSSDGHCRQPLLSCSLCPQQLSRLLGFQSLLQPRGVGYCAVAWTLHTVSSFLNPKDPEGHVSSMASLICSGKRSCFHDTFFIFP